MIPGILRKTSALLAGFALLAAPALSQNTTPAPAETRRLHVELTLEEAIRAAQEQSIAAMVAKYTFLSSYWSFRSFRASRLPSLNLSGEVLSFDRSLRLLQDYDTGEMRYLENYNLQNTIGLSIRQNIALTGGTLQLYSSLNRLDQFAPKDSKSYYSQPITLSYTQPLFAYNQFKWDKKIAPKEYELAKRTYIEAMEDVTTQAVSYYFALLLSKTRHEIAVKNYDNTKALYAIAEKRLKLGSITHDELLQLQLRMLNDSLSINDTSLEVREQQMRFNSYLRYNENVEVAPVLDDRIPAIDIDYAMVLDKALENSSFDIGNQIQMLNAESDIARARAERGASATLNARFGLSQTGEEFRTAYSNLLDQEVVGLQFSIPIFDWGMGKGRVRMARAKAEIVRNRIEQEEIDYRVQQLRPKLIEDVQTARAFGDLSENFEYKCAKQDKNRNDARIRYLQRMIKTARVIEDTSGADTAGLYDTVEIFMENMGKSRSIVLVTTLRQDALKGLISKESPVGRAVLGKRVGDRVYVDMGGGKGYYVQIRAIRKGTDDGSVPIGSF